MQAIIEALKGALISGETISLAYAFGSRPGEARPLVVVEFNEDSSAFWVREPDVDAIKTYVTKRVLWLVDQSGSRAENAELLALHRGFMQRRTEQQLAVQHVIDGSAADIADSYSIHAADAMRASLGGHPGTSFVIAGSGSPRRRAVINAIGIDGAKRICLALSALNRHGYRRLWDLVPTLLRAGYSWPIWQRYQDDVRSEADDLRGASPKLRDIDFRAEPGGQPTSKAYHQQREIYDLSRLRPPEVESEGAFFDRVRMFEGVTPDPGPMRESAQVVTDAPLTAYWLATRESGQLLQLPDEHIKHEHLSALIRGGLCVAAKEAPLDVLMARLRYMVLARPIREAKIGKPATRDLLGCKDFYLANCDSPLEGLLRKSTDLDGLHVLLPPISWTWDDLQDFRCHFLEMTYALASWMSGSDPDPVLREYCEGMV